MPRTRTARTPAKPRRRTEAAVSAIPYTRDPRWATPPARRRTDVFVVEIADRYASPSGSVDEDPLLLTA